ncbi:kinesin-domain-containing protein [Basidiobolus meristosporus CBS 931.73]|uniref:Kinesin-like protein n=1 Tax=Basidiobolus meristosporus CBS 931.73 TaxID=1314790 RepID=A0A1Y1XSG0_9FUNG|nr:kinesin-domain-containing protein [Basidiobolus meristosporus CBS 931.73]|eukprot:ORX88668.1 kinesin-domain-containing protein [Basidiobolus meristosporus CBS 931.73]
MGYNCTIFAYGQTGTGKTYTMEGNLEEVNNSFSKNAGIIPRTLHRLFERLESETAEYSVRLSFIELYNEELKDLLASDDDTKRLKIFEDISRKGSVVIHGLEEFLVNNAMDGIQLLQKGSLRRKMAATKCNDKSSRSHSVFSITVHIKESTPNGDDLLKVGKLNLVDLAGSENIGRSGAENKRAREAGMINQSLLTLGRVINSLVERSPHIPYRESKLTRLLQDSLGGKTKTCIIATVSPARINLEETQSTLDYASRAKSIRNKPEVNQKLTKKALIKEYVDEIERLKSDLMASRDKNGVYLTSENYQSLVDENRSSQDLINELNKKMETIQEQLNSTTEEFKLKMDLLNSTSERLATAEMQLEHTSSTLEETSQNLHDAKQTLEEQKVLTEAHAETEVMLNSLANGLVFSLKRSLEDSHHLHAKIDRKSVIEMENRRLFKEFQQVLTSQAENLEADIEEFKGAQHTFIDTCVSHLHTFVHQKLKEVAQQAASIDETLQSHAEQQSCLQKAFQGYKDSMASHHTQAEGSYDTIRVALRNQTETFQQLGKDLFETFSQELHKYHSGFTVWQEKMESNFHRLAKESKRQAEEQGLLLASMAQTVRMESEQEVSRLHQQNAELATALQHEKEKNAEKQSQLLTHVAKLVQEYSAKRQKNHHQTAGKLQSALSSNTASLQNLKSKVSSVSTGASSKNSDFMAGLAAATQQIVDKVATGSKHLEACSHNNVGLLDKAQARLSTRMSESLCVVDKQLKNMEAINHGLLDSSHKFYNGHLKESQDLRSEFAQKHNSSKSLDISMQSNILEHKNEMVASLSAITDAVNTLQSSVDEHLCDTKNTVNRVISQEIKVDRATGETPQKRKYSHSSTWPLTRPHEMILEEWRNQAEECSETR